MVGRLATISAVALLVAPLAFAEDGGPVAPVGGTTVVTAGGVATATLGNDDAGAATGAATIRLRAELQCGRLSSRTVTVHLPAAMKVPATIAASAVLVGGKPTASVKTTGSTVVITMPLPKGVTCMVLGPGTVAVTFTARVRLHNPASAGSYAFTVASSPRGSTWHGTLKIS
jgi:hypothetical protein